MKIYRAYLAVLFGVTLTVVFRTMLGATSRVGAIGLWPGAALTRVLSGGAAWAALAGCVVVYSALGGVLIWFLTRNRSVEELRRMAAFATLALPILVISAFAGTWALERKGLGGCRNSENLTVDSPDGQRKAVVFLRECRGDFSTHVAVWPLSLQMNHADLGNTLILVRTAENTARESGAVEVGLKWESPASLLVTYPGHARVILREGDVAGVTVRYKPAGQKDSGTP